jgi:hypothetical protein
MIKKTLTNFVFKLSLFIQLENKFVHNKKLDVQ